jgi:hypothetical protein
MNIYRRIKKLVSCMSILALLSVQISPVHAAMVNNDELLKQIQHNISVEHVLTMLDRDEIQDRLTTMGITPASAKARVNQMTDIEIAELQQNLDKMPAGSGAVGVLLTVFIVLVITDMLGATDVFPFVKNINK